MDSTNISYRIVQYLYLLDFYLLYVIVKLLLSHSTARMVKLLPAAKPLKFQQSTILYYPPILNSKLANATTFIYFMKENKREWCKMKYKIIMWVLNYIIEQCILDIVCSGLDNIIRNAATYKDLTEYY